MYQLRLTRYAGGEVRLCASLLRCASLAGDNEESSKEGFEVPVADSPPLLDYRPQLETVTGEAVTGAKVTGKPGFGEISNRVCKFNRRAKHQIQRAARALDEYVNVPREIVFFTGTLPGTGQAQYMAIAQWSSYIVHRLKAWVAKRLESKLDFYCWELQKRGALHLHYAVHCPDELVRMRLLKEFKGQWLRLLDSVSEFSGVDLYLNTVRGFSHGSNKGNVQAKAEEVTKGVGNYLGKYLSKSAASSNGGGVFAPCRWWGVSRPLRLLEEKARQEIKLHYGNKADFLRDCEDFSAWLPRVSDVFYDWKSQATGLVSSVGYGVCLNTLNSVYKVVTGKSFMVESRAIRVSRCVANFVEIMAVMRARFPHWYEMWEKSAYQAKHLDEFSCMTLNQLNSGNYAQPLYSLAVNTEDFLASGRRSVDGNPTQRNKASILCCAVKLRDVALELAEEVYESSGEVGFYD